MSDWTVHLEFEEGTSSKFWRARVEGRTLYVNYGKIGSAGQTQVKDFATPDLADKEYGKLVREKRKKGYVDAGAGGAGSGGGGGGDVDDDDEVNDDREDDDEDDDDMPVTTPRARPQVSAPAAPAARPPGGVRLLLESGNRKVETYLYMDGARVRMDATETYANPEAAKKAQERLKRMLLAEGYKES